jgi:hypothetical protein
VTPQIVIYHVDESTTVKFEIEPTDGFRPTGPDQALGWVKEAVTSAVEVGSDGLVDAGCRLPYECRA